MLVPHSRPSHRRSVARAALLILPLSLLLCAACGQTEPAARACTMIGCDSGITVQLAAMPDAPFSVEVSPVGGPATVKECVTAEACGSDLFFTGVSADSIIVKVSSPAGEAITRAKAQYAVSRPNGPQCDPECRQARVSATVPE